MAVESGEWAVEEVRRTHFDAVFLDLVMPGVGSAGALIEEAGLKGLRRGGVSVSRVHANFIVNDNCGSASDVLAVIDEVREKVAARFGVWLQLEVRPL